MRAILGRAAEFGGITDWLMSTESSSRPSRGFSRHSLITGAEAAPEIRKRVVFGHGRASVLVVSFPLSSLVRFRAASVPEKYRKIDASFVRLGR